MESKFLLYVDLQEFCLNHFDYFTLKTKNTGNPSLSLTSPHLISLLFTLSSLR